MVDYEAMMSFNGKARLVRNPRCPCKEVNKGLESSLVSASMAVPSRYCRAASDAALRLVSLEDALPLLRCTATIPALKISGLTVLAASLSGFDLQATILLVIFRASALDWF